MFKRVPIFSYHAVLSEELDTLPEDWSPYHAITFSAFRQQLDALTAAGFRAAAPQVLTQPSLPRKTAVITFDDGQVTDLDAAGELKRRGMTAAFFVTWTRLGSPSFLTRKDVVELDRLGFTIGSHGVRHTRLSDLGPEQLREELVGSRKMLEDLTGKPVTALAIPFGAYSNAVIAAAAAAGYRSILTSDFALAVPGRSVYPRLTITPRITCDDFKMLLADSPLLIARRRLVNGIHRRLNRIRALAAGQ